MLHCYLFRRLIPVGMMYIRSNIDAPPPSCRSVHCTGGNSRFRAREFSAASQQNSSMRRVMTCPRRKGSSTGVDPDNKNSVGLVSQASVPQWRHRRVTSCTVEYSCVHDQSALLVRRRLRSNVALPQGPTRTDQPLFRTS